jgi:hypothetical protein
VNIEEHAVQRGILKHDVYLNLNTEEPATHLTENTQHRHYKNRLILFREITVVRCEYTVKYTVWVVNCKEFLNIKIRDTHLLLCFNELRAYWPRVGLLVTPRGSLSTINSRKLILPIHTFTACVYVSNQTNYSQETLRGVHTFHVYKEKRNVGCCEYESLNTKEITRIYCKCDSLVIFKLVECSFRIQRKILTSPIFESAS